MKKTAVFLSAIVIFLLTCVTAFADVASPGKAIMMGIPVLAIAVCIGVIIASVFAIKALVKKAKKKKQDSQSQDGQSEN